VGNTDKEKGAFMFVLKSKRGSAKDSAEKAAYQTYTRRTLWFIWREKTVK
jgi:hypothetical protein